MARIAFLIKQPKRTLGALAVLVAATGIVAGSGANFTASSANPSNTFATGSLSIDNSKEGAAILTAANLRPGGPAATGTVDIQNSGTLGGTFTLSRDSLTNTDATNPLSGKLNIVVKDCGLWADGTTVNPCGDGDDTVVYGSPTATLTAMSSPVALGTFAAEAKHRYEFSVALDSSAGDAYQGGQSTFRFVWNAVQ